MFKRSPQKNTTITERNLFYWVIHSNLKLQLLLVVLIVLVVFARVLPLEMQKRIINDSIALRKFDNLISYCLIYLAAVTTASGLKLAINYLQTLIGERAMATMRRELYKHILTLPLSFFRKTQPGMVVSSLVTELSTAGSYAGMALAVPITNVFTLLAFAAYLLWLNTKLALATLGIYPVIVFLLPYLQKRANVANRERVDMSRKVSSQITESITGIHEVQVHGAYNRENSKFSMMTESLRRIRVRWTFLKFGIKTTNNFFVSLGPFIVFLYGGYLSLSGELALGALVAFLSAQEKLYDPWKELIDFYQVHQDAKVRYTRTMDHFRATPDFDPEDVGEKTLSLKGKIEIENLVFETEEGTRLLDDVSLTLNSGMHLAVVGFSGSGKSTLVQCIAKMHQYSLGNIRIDGYPLDELTKKDIISNIGYISQSPFVFTGTVLENLMYGERAVSEIGKFEFQEDDEQPSGLNKESAPTLDQLILVLQQAGLFVDVMRFGLETTIDADTVVMREKIIRIRKNFRRNFGDDLADYIEFYDRDSYQLYSTIADNIFFGDYQDRNLGIDTLLKNEEFHKFLTRQKLAGPLLELGWELARQATDILADFGSEELFFQFSPVKPASLERCNDILARVHGVDIQQLRIKDQIFLLGLAMSFIPGIHKASSLDEKFKEQILVARSAWKSWSDTHYPNRYIHYNEEEYIHNQSLLNNIFFGRPRTDLPHGQETINQAIIHLLIEEDCLEEIAGIGMDFQVGSMGDKLSGGQRQKLAIARVLLKKPQIIIMDEATSALDNKSQSRIQKLQETRWKGKRTIISVVHRLDSIANFDCVAVMKSGKLIEYGPYTDLMEKKGVLYELVSGRR